MHLIAFLEPTIGRNTAGIAVAITTAMAIMGRLVLGTIADRTEPAPRQRPVPGQLRRRRWSS